MLDRTSDRPAYRQIADALREQIASGELPPGAQLSSVRQLASEYRITEVIVRRALGLLRGEGLIDSQPGRGSFVRRAPSMLRLSEDRYDRSNGPASSSAQVDGVASGDREMLRLEPAPASPEVAERLKIAEGTLVLVQTVRLHAAGQPMQTVTSYMPFHLVEGTELASAAARPWERDAVKSLGTLGVHVDAVIEEVTARMPRPEELRALGLSEGVPLLTTTRTMLSGDQPVETADLTMPADRYRLAYRIPVDQADDLRLIVSFDELLRELLLMVQEADEYLVVTGSRSRDPVYLKAMEEALRSRPRLVHYRILFGPPKRPALQDHLTHLLELRDPQDRSQGFKTLHVGVMDDVSEEPERYFVATEKRALTVIPSLVAAGNYDTAVVFRTRERARLFVEHGRQLYAASRKVETVEAVRDLGFAS